MRKPYLFALVAVAAIAVYANTLGHSFVFDDTAGILENPRISSLQHFSQLWQFLIQPWRGLTEASYALTVYFAGLNPAPFHATNIAIHAINSMLVFAIALRLAARWLRAGETALFGLAAGFIHAVHPLYSQGVAYVWGRSSSLCATFYFGSLLMMMAGHEQSGRRKLLCYGAALLLGIAAWKTKEEAITLPLVAAGFLALTGASRSAAVVVLAPLVLVATAWRDVARLFHEVAENRDLVSAGFAPSLPPLAHFLTELKVAVFHYLRLFLVPVSLNVDPQIAPSRSLFEPLTALAAVILIVLAVVAYKFARRRPVISFALVALLISPLTAYAVMPVADVAAEHRVYIAGLGFDLLVAWLLTRSVRHGPWLLMALVAVLGFTTLERNRVWANSLMLWQDAERKSPGLVRPHLNLGLAYQTQGDNSAAMQEYRHVLDLNPRVPLAWINIGALHLTSNDLDQAEACLKKAAEIAPSLPQPYINLSALELRRNRPVEALTYIDKAQSLGDSDVVHLARGDVLAQLGRYGEAAGEYERAIELGRGESAVPNQARERLNRLKGSSPTRR